jgi:hypothetical protein
MSRYVVVGSYAESDVQLCLHYTDDLLDARRYVTGERRRKSGCDLLAVIDTTTGQPAAMPHAKRLVIVNAHMQGHTVRRVSVARAS